VSGAAELICEPGSEALRAALAEVLDPEYPVSLVDLGLIRGTRLEGSTAHVQLVYCNLGCPCTELINDDIEARLLELDGVESVEIEEVFDRWRRADVSQKGLRQLRQVGVA
jgi:metal-sulfur cluster biosynthetic enzyme